MYTGCTNISCGVLEAYDLLDSPLENIRAMAWNCYASSLVLENADKVHYEPEVAFIIFSDIIGIVPSNGQRLATYIRRHWPKSKLVRSSTKVNPGTGNRIAVWTWSLPPRLTIKKSWLAA